MFASLTSISLFTLPLLALHFFTPAPVYLGPLTFEQEIVRTIPTGAERRAIERAFERLQDVYGPAVVTLRYQDPRNDTKGPVEISIDVSPPAHFDDAHGGSTTDVAPAVSPIASLSITPRPGALFLPSPSPKSTTQLFFAFSVMASFTLASAMMLIAATVKPNKLNLATSAFEGKVTRRGCATKPLCRSSGETRRPRKIQEVLAISSIEESPWVFNGGGFLKALETLAREQRDAQHRQSSTVNAEPHPVDRSIPTPSTSPKPVITGPLAAPPKKQQSSDMLYDTSAAYKTTATHSNRPHDCIACQTQEVAQPGELLYETKAVKSTTTDQILYQTRGITQASKASVIYETPTTSPATLIYATSGFKKALPSCKPTPMARTTHRSSTISFHGPTSLGARPPLTQVSANVPQNAFYQTQCYKTHGSVLYVARPSAR
ncbi:hypothetical protein GGX14DRAFT_385454 [Mycena pura]|uniref:Uncharacterized protein n=1 Tax=Mycena pura TaxID=153505 RepID=A0AAD6YU98_9AGAR|nr:hypothetical protein GGX14DRAFT_385454 [Mycena pura]